MNDKEKFEANINHLECMFEIMIDAANSLKSKDRYDAGFSKAAKT